MNHSDGYDVPADSPAFMQELEDCALNIRRAAQKILRDTDLQAEDDPLYFAATTLNHEVARLAVIVQCGIMELGHLLKQSPGRSEGTGDESPHLSVASSGNRGVS